MKSLTDISFTGLNFERLVNTVVKSGIPVVKARRLGRKQCLLTVYTANTDKVIALLQEKCYNNIRIRRRGLSAFWQNCKRHIAVFIAAVLFFPCIAVTSCFCFDVKIDAEDSDAVKTAVESYGIKIGSPLVGLNIDEFENYLCTTLDVSYAIVDRRGSVLSVKIIDKVDKSDPIDLTTPRDIVATHGGVVTRITVIQGTAAVKVGDEVQKGQVLIHGRRTFADGTYKSVRAIGEVYAEVCKVGRAEFNLQTVKTVQTGNTFTRTTVKIANCVSQKDSPFEMYQTQVLSAVTLPLGIVVTTELLCEVEEQTVTSTLEQQLPELNKLALERALKGADFTPAQTVYGVKDGVVTVTVRGERKINGEKLLEGGT
ncbi:MAG: sporulation protein YqfD [Corallococcus sp.]|nr:sporulation protein YqfD [Corallococcus sp.]